MSEVIERVAIKTVPLGELLTDIRNGLVVEQEKELPGIPITRIETISKGTVDMDRVRYVRDAAGKSLDNFWLKKGDILFSHINSDLHLGKTALVLTDTPLLHGMNLLRLRVDSNRLRPKYLHHWLDYCRRIGVFMAIAQHAVNQSSLNQKKITSLAVPLLPVDKQDEIVAELEKQFSRFDEAVANLQRVKANLKRYKASVLKAAVEGRLVETEASLAHREGRIYETGEQLLQRILEERRANWAGKGKYKEPASADVLNQPELPAGWSLASLDMLSTDSGYGTSQKCAYESEGPAVLRIPNVQHGVLDLQDLKFAPSDFKLVEAEAVTQGDMLIIRTNGSKSLIGRAAVVMVSQSRQMSFASYLIRFRLSNAGCIPKWVSLVWQTSQMREWIESHAATSAGQHNVSMTVLAKAAIPIPPATEQAQIVAEVDRHLSIVREVETEVDTNLKRAQTLRQATLAKAFSIQR